jgi:hypothetical protein
MSLPGIEPTLAPACDGNNHFAPACFNSFLRPATKLLPIIVSPSQWQLLDQIDGLLVELRTGLFQTPASAHDRLLFFGHPT